MGDLRDPLVAERFAQTASDEYFRRRDFLGRTAVGAGLAAGMAMKLSPATLIAERRSGRARSICRPHATCRSTPFVVLMMENRSFDHYLGWLPRRTGCRRGWSYVDLDGKTWETRPPGARLAGLRPPRPRPLLGRRAASSSTAAVRRLPETGNDRSSDLLLRREGTWASSRAAAKAFTTYDHSTAR